jgi:phosphoglycerate dehydrogenase-like enzyme
MNAVNRLLTLGILAVASTASLVEMWPQLGPQSDLWRVADYLRQIDGLCNHSDQLDSQFSQLRRLAADRTQVMEALREGRLTASQAVDRFVDLDSIRSEVGLANAPHSRSLSARELARAEVLGMLRQMPKAEAVATNSEPSSQALRELEGSAPLSVKNAFLR